MEDSTLQVILGRFDKLDSKLDAQATQLSSIASRVTAAEVKLEPLVTEATFRRRANYLGHVLAGSIGAGIMLAFNAIWPHYVPPPSILHKSKSNDPVYARAASHPSMLHLFSERTPRQTRLVPCAKDGGQGQL
jgi:hypothetical protein